MPFLYTDLAALFCYISWQRWSVTEIYLTIDVGEVEGVTLRFNEVLDTGHKQPVPVDLTRRRRVLGPVGQSIGHHIVDKSQQDKQESDLAQKRSRLLVHGFMFPVSTSLSIHFYILVTVQNSVSMFCKGLHC